MMVFHLCIAITWVTRCGVSVSPCLLVTVNHYLNGLSSSHQNCYETYNVNDDHHP